MNLEQIAFEQFQNFIEMVTPCTDNYLFYSNLTTDTLYISSNAVERFNLPGSLIENSMATLSRYIYSADVAMVQKDLLDVVAEKKPFHDLDYRWLDRDGKTVWVNCRGNVLFDEEGNPRYMLGCLNEIGRKQKADNISGLLREAAFYMELEEHTDDHLDGFILRIGIDNFKEINENKGIDYGDMILQKTAECVEKVVLPGQKLYRLVADEFAIVDFTGRNLDSAKELYRLIRNEIDDFIESNQYEVFYTVSAGIVDLQCIQRQKYDNLMKITEFSLNQAKSIGKNQYYIFNQRDYDDFRHRRWLIQVMRKAINHNYRGFDAYYQPIVDIQTKQVIGAETLLRFKTGETGMISPGEFVPLLEDSGLIIPVGRWILYQALEACEKIRQVIPNFRMSVNVSYIQVLKSDVLKDIQEALRTYNLPPESLMVELTESGLLEDNLRFRRFCEGIRETGVLLALDDFGTGYSNFHYLYSLNPYTIKIDRSFTLKAIQSQNEYNLLRHMVEMTHGIELKLCIEGVETEEELLKISGMNPDYIQGYYFGRPVDLQEFWKKHVDALKN